LALLHEFWKVQESERVELRKRRAPVERGMIFKAEYNTQIKARGTTSTGPYSTDSEQAV
jgi:hypothetical protein